MSTESVQITLGGHDNVQKRRTLLLRLARLKGQTPQKSLHNKDKSTGARTRAEGTSSPYQTAPTVAQWAADYQTAHRGRFRGGGNLNALTHLAAIAGRKRLSQLNDHDLAKVLSFWKQYGYASFTVRSMHDRLKAALRSGEAWGIPRGLHKDMPAVAAGKPRQRTATAAELEKLTAQAAPWMRLLLLLCWHCGLRSGTAERVAPRNYNQENGTITVRTKGGRDHTVAITDQVRTILNAALPTPHEAVPFIDLLRGRTIESKSGYGQEFAKLKRACGINIDLRLHDMRRTQARALYQITGDLRSVQQLLGHSRLLTTLHYLDNASFPAPTTGLLQQAVINTKRRGGVQ